MKIGFFGHGNMGKAISLALQSKNPNLELFIYTPSGNKSIAFIPKDLDFYFLAFKPQSLEEFQFDFSKDSKIISLLAGVGIEKLVQKFKTKKIARLMPNTPAKYQTGSGLLYFPNEFTLSEKNQVIEMLVSTGKIFEMNSEDELDRTTGFSGSGPGIIFELARIFEEELIALTHNKKEAREIVAQTFFGSATLMQNEALSFKDLRDNVTSKKGVTFEALKILEDNKMQNVFKQAFSAAYKRTQELKN